LLEQNEIRNDQQNRADDIYERHCPGDAPIDPIAKQMKNNRRSESEKNNDDDGIESDDDRGHRFILQQSCIS